MIVLLLLLSLLFIVAGSLYSIFISDPFGLSKIEAVEVALAPHSSGACGLKPAT